MNDAIIPFGDTEPGTPPVMPFADVPKDEGLSLTHPERNLSPLQKIGLIQTPVPGEEDPLALTLQKKVAQVVPIVKASTGGVLQSIGETLSTPDPNEAQNVFGSGAKSTVREMGKNLAAYGIDLRQRSSAESQQLEPNVAPGTTKAFLGDVAGTTARMVPSILGGIISGAATANPAVGANVGLAIMFPDLYGEMYGKQRDKNLDPDRALLDAMASAAQNTALEKVPLGIVFKHGGTALRSILAGAGAEGLTEYVQSAIDDLIEQGTLHGDMSVHEAFDRLMSPEVQKDLLYQAAVGGVSGAMFGAGAHAAGVTNPAATPPDIVYDPHDRELGQATTDSVMSQLPEQQPTAPAFDAVRLGSVHGDAAHFSEPGPSVYFDPENPDTKPYKYAADIRIADPYRNRQELNPILNKALENESLTAADRRRIEELRSEDSIITYKDAEELGLHAAAQALDYDGMRVFEHDDITDPTTVNIWNLSKVQEVPVANENKTPTGWSQVSPEVVDMTGKSINDMLASQVIYSATDDNIRRKVGTRESVWQDYYNHFLQQNQNDTIAAGVRDPKLRVAGFQQGWPEGTADKVYKTVRAWKERFAPQLVINITDGSVEAEASAHSGQEMHIAAGTGFLGKMYRHNDGAYGIIINKNVFGNRDFAIGIGDRELFNTLSHEFGHVIAFDMLARAPESIQKGVQAAYEDWHKGAFTARLEDLLKEKYTAQSAERWNEYFTGRYGLYAGNDTVHQLLMRHGKDAVHRMQYLLSFDEWLADQYARYASSPGQGLSLVERFFTRVASYLKAFFKSLSFNRFDSAEGYVRFLKWASETRFLEMMSNESGVKVAKNYESLSAYIPNLPHTIKNMWKSGGDIDRFNSVMNQLYTIRQIAQLNPHIDGLQRFMTGLEAMSVTKNKTLHNAEERLVDLSNLGKEKLNNVGKFLIEETVGGKKLNLNDPAVLQQYNLDAQGVEVINKIKADFANVLDQLERALSADILSRYFNDPVKMQQEAQRLSTQFNRMRATPYFPLARFGSYTVVVRAANDTIIDGRAFTKGSVVDMRTFPSESEQKAGHKEATDDYTGNDVKIGMDYLEDSAFEFQGIPPQVFEALEGELNLTTRQIESLKQYRTDNAPGRSFLKHLKRRNKTYGYSEDAERAYADYMLRASNHIARISHYKILNAGKAEVGESATMIQKQGGDATRRRKIHEYMARAYEYVMNPTNEWASLRSLAFQWHLGLNVKSAFVQVTQLPLATYPLLAHDHGDVKATAAMVKAMKNAYDVWKNPNAIAPDARAALKAAEDAGVVNQSFATMVAGISEGHALQRLVPGSQGAKMIRDGAYLTSWMFQKMELLNRRVTFLAAFDLAKQSGKPIDQAYEYAKNAVQDSQGEYSKWNRPQLFRGKKGIMFIFKSYTQFMMFNFLHSRARVRFLMMMGLMGGLLGMPLAEDLLDVFDWAMSWGDKKWDTRKMMREFLSQLTTKPDLIMHGLSRESFGLAALAHAIGVPFPRVDLSGSISMGRVVPGLQGLMQPGKLSDRLERAAADTAGAGIAIPLTLAKAIVEYDRNPDKARLLGNALPPAMKNVARAFRWGTEGGEKDARGALRVPMSWQDTEQRAEIIASALGFQPTSVNVQREQDEMFKRHAEFYMLRQQLLLQNFAYAYMTKDREGLADVRSAIRTYNSEVPSPTLRITGETLRKSVKDRVRNVQKLQRGIPLEGKKYTGLYREIDRLFPDEQVEMELLRNQGIAPVLPFGQD